MKTLTVLSPGPLSTVQDLGRPGYGHLGIGSSGAADRLALQLANRILGNEDGAAAIEMTLGRLRVRLDFNGVITLTGAPCAFEVGGRAGRMNERFKVLAGDQIRVAAPAVGLRTYLAVQGGISIVPVLGSRSTDTLSGIGPETLAAGTVLPVGEGPVPLPPHPTEPHPTAPHPAAPHPAAPHPTAPDPTAPDAALPEPPELNADPTLAVHPGPRDDWFTQQAWQTLCTATWTVTAEANRVGVRLAGPMLDRRLITELPSEPMVVGALQVPPNGQPIIFLADHPVTGGYPVIGVVRDNDIGLAAQLRPGRFVRFRQFTEQ